MLPTAPPHAAAAAARSHILGGAQQCCVHHDASHVRSIMISSAAPRRAPLELQLAASSRSQRLEGSQVAQSEASSGSVVRNVCSDVDVCDRHWCMNASSSACASSARTWCQWTTKPEASQGRALVGDRSSAPWRLMAINSQADGFPGGDPEPAGSACCMLRASACLG